MRIPKSFSLLNRNYKVEVLEGKVFMDRYNELCQREEDRLKHPLQLFGATFRHGLIILNESAHEDEEDLFITFLHETVHAILYADGFWLPSEHNEQTVERLANMVHHILKTMKGEHKVTLKN